jgi:hypothetical protein
MKPGSIKQQSIFDCLVRTGFNTTSVHVGYVMGEVALGQVLSQ